MRLITVLFVLCSASVASAQEPTQAEIEEYQRWSSEFISTLEPYRGEVGLDEINALLHIPDDFYYLDAEDARAVLEEAWGNPPDETVLGMIFPSRYTPLDQDSWGVALSYEKSGYVSDDDAASIDYDELLKQMKSDARAENTARVEQGYEPIELIGWAEPPSYNASTHKIYWAKQLRFGEQPQDTLNYNVRVLGRFGVLNMNFIASMEQLEEVRNAAPAVQAMAKFREGSRYSDFNPSTDKVASYGIAGLIAGGAGAAVLKKTGLLAVALMFLKKGWFVILIALSAIGGWIRRFMSKGK